MFGQELVDSAVVAVVTALVSLGVALAVAIAIVAGFRVLHIDDRDETDGESNDE